MQKPKITFLMLAYNAEKYLDQAIDSILAQTEQNINLLVRNNGSTDGTGSILRKKADADARVRIFENKLNWKTDDGKSFAKDGIIRIWPVQESALLGEYISIVDADDWLTPDFAERMYNAAKAVDADITVCGNTFMLDGIKNTGERLPPDITTNDLLSDSDTISNNYVQLHNTFRTWWGKLFRTEFFLQHYDDAWKAVGGGYGDVLDTAIMLRYLCKAKSLASVVSALYQFRSSSSSTYGNRPPNYNRTLEAEELYSAGLQFLNTFSASTEKNIALLLQLHWAYILESLQCLNVVHEGFTGRQELSWISSLLNNPVLSQFYSSNEQVVFATALQYTQIVVEREKSVMNLYTAYLARLLFVIKELDVGSHSQLLYPILLSCLYDRENTNKLGLHLLNRTTVSPSFSQYFSGSQEFQCREMRSSTACPSFYSKGVTDLFNTQALEGRMDASAQISDYVTVCDLIEEISSINPLNRNAMYHRIRMAQIAGMRELSAVLAGTALALWPTDADMQLLCWNVLRTQQEGEI